MVHPKRINWLHTCQLQEDQRSLSSHQPTYSAISWHHSLFNLLPKVVFLFNQQGSFLPHCWDYVAVAAPYYTKSLNKEFLLNCRSILLGFFSATHHSWLLLPKVFLLNWISNPLGFIQFQFREFLRSNWHTQFEITFQTRIATQKVPKFGTRRDNKLLLFNSIFKPNLLALRPSFRYFRSLRRGANITTTMKGCRVWMKK